MVVVPLFYVGYGYDMLHGGTFLMVAMLVVVGGFCIGELEALRVLSINTDLQIGRIQQLSREINNCSDQLVYLDEATLLAKLHEA